MKFDAEKGDYGMVYDAEGNLIAWAISDRECTHERSVRSTLRIGDTVTGRVVISVRDHMGHHMVDGNGNLRRMTALYKAPLTLVPVPEMSDDVDQ